MGEEDGRPRPEICSRPLGRYQSSKFHTTEGIKSIEDRITVSKDAFPCQVYIKIVSGLKKNQKANQSKAHERTHGYICLPRPSQKLKTQTQNPPEESKKEKKRKPQPDTPPFPATVFASVWLLFLLLFCFLSHRVLSARLPDPSSVHRTPMTHPPKIIQKGRREK